MKTIVAIALVMGLSGSAMAGAFVGLGVGTPSHLSDDQLLPGLGSDGRTGRLMAGYSLPIAYGHLAIEGAYMGYGLALPNHRFDGRNLWLAGRYNYGLSDGFEVFGRLGIMSTSFDASDSSGLSFSGKGPVMGVGAEFHPRFKLGLDLSFWVDLTYDHVSLQRGEIPSTTPASDHFATMGVTVGF